jgi:hypothetical protein
MEELLLAHSEPLPNIPPAQPTQAAVLDEAPVDLSTAIPELPLPYANIRSSDNTSASSPFVVKFPSSSAGAPISHHGRHAHESYRESIRSQSSAAASDASNMYAPFASKLDWEIAQWAKLRGPGSTAFSELLAIDGVSKFKSSLCIY